MFDQLAEPVGAITNDVQDRAEHFFAERCGVFDFENMRRDEEAIFGRVTGKMHTRGFLHFRDMGIKPCFRLRIDHRADMRIQFAWIADFQFARGFRDHRDHSVGDVFLNA